MYANWFLYFSTGFEQNFKVCQIKYSSWCNCWGWTTLLCLCSLKPWWGCCSPCWANFALCYIFFKGNTNHGLWRERNFWCNNDKQGFFSAIGAYLIPEHIVNFSFWSLSTFLSGKANTLSCPWNCYRISVESIISCD